MRKVILTRGMQASSKTTWAKEFIKNDPSYIRISRDDFRHMLDSYSFSDETEKIVTKMVESCIIDAIAYNKNIIIDEMHLNKTRLQDRINFFISKNYEVEVKEFPVHVSEAIERDKRRSFPIGEKVLNRTWKTYEVELRQMIDRHKPQYPWDHKLPYCIICDIDGTLSHSPQRRIYSNDVIDDKVIFPVWSILDKYKDKVTVVLMSGRDETCRAATEAWLKKEGVNYQHLYMRKDKDHRSDTIIKRELFDEHIRGVYQPMFVIDDRPCVVEMWVDMGLFVFNVNQDPRCKNDF